MDVHRGSALSDRTADCPWFTRMPVTLGCVGNLGLDVDLIQSSLAACCRRDDANETATYSAFRWGGVVSGCDDDKP